MSGKPNGTVTFLFTDIENSTKRWEQHPQQMRAALSRHDAILNEAIEAQGGFVFKTVGDAFCVAFSAPTDALQAAITTQRLLSAEQWPQEIGQLRVRMALHTGVAQLQGGDYFGQPLNRVARILSAGHGGQTLISAATQELVRDHLPPRTSLTDLGEHRLKDLTRSERIFQLASDSLPTEFPPLKTLDSRPNNLPEQLTPFIGREKQIGQVAQMLCQPGTRLVTLTGPGGTGKTRLALQVGAELIDEMEHGVYFVNLAPLTDPALVASEIAQTLGVRESGGQPLIQSLKDYLREKQLLLLLDNFEQVTEAAIVVADLLKTSSLLKVLVTSRVPLHVSGEQEYAVPPLSLPDKNLMLSVEALSQYEAVALFIQRAQLVKPDFHVTNESAPAVAEICYRLDGLPLAIELAAARIKFFTPQALLLRLQSRLKMLTGGARDQPARQQTLRAAIEWSYDLLSEEEKKLFRRLAVFMGGRGIEAAEAVCNADGDLDIDVVDGMLSLADKSLLRQEEGVGVEPRFVMLETIHEYAREMLEESEEAERMRNRHLFYFMALAEEAEQRLIGPQQREWLERLEEEHGNIRAALSWAQCDMKERLELGLRLAGALDWFWDVRGHWTEGREQIAPLLSRLPQGSRTAVQAEAMNAIARLMWRQNDNAHARQLLEESLVICQQLGEKALMVDALEGLGAIASDSDPSEARLRFEASLEIARELGDKERIASLLNHLGNSVLDDPIAARAFHEESSAIRTELGDQYGIAQSLNNLGEATRVEGDYAAARVLYEKSLKLRREIGDRRGIALQLMNLAWVTLHDEEITRAEELLAESLSIFRALGSIFFTGSCLSVAASIAAARQEGERAARLFGAFSNLYRFIGMAADAADSIEHDRYLEVARAQLNEAAWEKAWEEGRGMTIEHAINYALEKS